MATEKHTHTHEEVMQALKKARQIIADKEKSSTDAATGACIFEDGSCVNGITQTSCLLLLGTYYGDNTTCP
jgi:hypothetical protein